MKKIIFFFVLTLFFTSCKKNDPINAPTPASIIGIVVDATTNNKISGAELQLVPMVNLILSDNAGKFAILNLDSGNYELKVQKDGYYPYSKIIALKAMENQNIIVPLVKIIDNGNQNGNKDGLLAFWSFDNLSTDDSSGNNNNAIAYSNMNYVPGIKGNAIYFKGSQDNDPNAQYVQLPSINFKQMPEFSISLWVYEKGMVNEITGAGGGNSYIIFGDHGAGWLGVVNIWGRPRYDIALHHQFAVGAYWVDNSAPYVAGITLNMDSLNYRNRWMHYAMTYKNNILTAYVNGDNVGSITQEVKIVGNDAFLGRVRWNNGYNSASRFIGMMDEVRIYSKALNKDEVYSLFKNP